MLKALDGAGGGFTSNVLTAIDYAIAQRDKYNIRVINLSVSAGVFESYNKDPLTLAAKRAVDAGIVVVAAAGNLGRNIARTGAAWRHLGARKRTLGAHHRREQRTTARSDRSDDRVAGFSSRGPSAIDRSFEARPRGAGSGDHLAGGTVERVVCGESAGAPVGRGGNDQRALPDAERNEHVGAGRRGHSGADAPGESRR